MSAKPINPPWAPPVYRVIGAGHPWALSVYIGLFGGNPETQFSDILPPAAREMGPKQSKAKKREPGEQAYFRFPSQGGRPARETPVPKRTKLSRNAHPSDNRETPSAEPSQIPVAPEAEEQQMVPVEGEGAERLEVEVPATQPLPAGGHADGYADSRLGFFFQDARALSSRFWMPPRRVLLWHIFNPCLVARHGSAQMLCSVASTLWTQNANTSPE